MDRFQIAKYGLIQATAITYAIFLCGAATKYGKFALESGYQVPSSYYAALFVRNYGIFFFLIALGWVASTAYLSSTRSAWEVREGHLAYSGMGFAILIMMVGTFVAFAASTGLR